MGKWMRMERTLYSPLATCLFSHTVRLDAPGKRVNHELHQHTDLERYVGINYSVTQTPTSSLVDLAP